MHMMTRDAHLISYSGKPGLNRTNSILILDLKTGAPCNEGKTRSHFPQ